MNCKYCKLVATTVFSFGKILNQETSEMFKPDVLSSRDSFYYCYVT